MNNTPYTDEENDLQCELAAWELLREATRERDEAIKALADWENAALHVEADHPDERHCGCVPVLRKLLSDARDALRKAIRFVDAYEPHSRRAEEDQNETLSIIRKVLEGVK